MKVSSNKTSLSFKIFLAVLFLPVVICILNGLYEVLTFNKEEYVISQLERRYYGEFECIGKAGNNDNDKDTFYIKSSLRPDLIITATYWEGWNQGPMSAVPFNLDYQKVAADDFFRQLINEKVDGIEPIDLNKVSVDSATDSVMDLINSIDDLKKEYIKPDIYKDSRFTITFTYNGKTQDADIEPGMNRKWTESNIRTVCNNLILKVS